MEISVHAIDATLVAADREWRALGVHRRDRAALDADLRLELEAAAADGVSPDRLIGEDVPGFARRLAAEAGVRQVRPEYSRLLGVAFLGAVAGAVLGFLLMSGLYTVAVAWFDLPRDVRVPVLLAAGVYYGIPALVVVAGAIVAVRMRMRDVPGVRRTALAMAVLLPASSAVIVPATMGFARVTDYSLDPVAVLTEAAMVIGGLAGATVLARRWSMRDDRDVTVPAR